MNLSGLLKRATPAPEPIFIGTWGMLLLKPDLGSQQEFIVGVVAAIEGDVSAHVKWVPSLAKLSKLYGDAIATIEISGLLDGCDRSISASFKGSLAHIDCGSPHVRVVFCGYFSADDVNRELTGILKRHASAIWAEHQHREDPMDDDWAYSEMLKALEVLKAPTSIIVPQRRFIVGRRQLSIAFDNERSFGTVISARYANFSTIERHILLAHVEVNTAHKLTGRLADPALFVVLPPANASEDAATRQKSINLLSDIEDSGTKQYSSSDPVELARYLEEWAHS